ncbi:hypothetical protein SteCoe_3125 [Stentor coeruleus]|uniref:Uncharacterized protein n=1 Tax=Stentor coeruleus TaxID=5963 RepID=A0A1R2CXS9_9CILI|nr:hypothetical protein SteCoe_3125 [Stentor coeruleus]
MITSNNTEQTIQVISSKKGSLSYKNLGKYPSMTSLCQSCDRYYFLSISNQLFSLQISSISRISIPSKVHRIASNKETTLILTNVGVYYIGNDLFGVTFAHSAKPVKDLEQTYLIEASLGKSHAAGIDDLGNLYIWGPNHGYPKPIDSAKAFSASKVACTDHVTCVCTSGGYFYIYGWFGVPETSLSPFALPELEKHFIIDLCASGGFCGLLTEDGIVLAFDENKDVVRMPSSGNTSQIFAFSYGIFAFSGFYMYKWHGNVVRDWQLEVYKSSGDFRVLGEVYGGVGVQGECSFEYQKTLEAYQLSYDSQGFFTKSRENPFNICYATQSPMMSLNSTACNLMISPKSLASPVKQSLYSSLFPGEDTFMKLLSYRKQYQQSGIVVQVIRPIIIPHLKFALDKIKKAAKTKHLLSKTMLFTFLPSVSERLLKKCYVVNTSFGFLKIAEFARFKKRKEEEKSWVLKNKYRVRIEKFEGIAKKMRLKEKYCYGECLMKKIREVNEKEKNKIRALEDLSRIRWRKNFVLLKKTKIKWVKFCKSQLYWEKGLKIIHKVAMKKLGTYSFKQLKTYHYIQSLKFNKLKSAIKLVSYKAYINQILHYFTAWCRVLYTFNANKEKSYKIYNCLGKHIFAVISHKYKSHMKFALQKLHSSAYISKLIKSYKNPLLYFTTVMSKIFCRLKFSTFSSIQRSKEKAFLALNINSADKLHNFMFLINQMRKQQLKYALDGLKEIKTEDLTISCGTLEEMQDQTTRFFRNLDSGSENAQGNSQIVPKLPLQMIKSKKKPPTTMRHAVMEVKKVPWKAPNRSGSYTGLHTREDSLSRRKNYDNQLRGKIKTSEKTMKKPDLPRPNMNLIAKRKKSKVAETKFLDMEKNEDFIENNDTFFKYSLGLLALRRLWEKTTFAFILFSFKILKSCYKYSREPYSAYTSSLSNKSLR